MPLGNKWLHKGKEHQWSDHVEMIIIIVNHYNSNNFNIIIIIISSSIINSNNNAINLLFFTLLIFQVSINSFSQELFSYTLSTVPRTRALTKETVTAFLPHYLGDTVLSSLMLLFQLSSPIEKGNENLSKAASLRNNEKKTY